MILSFRRVLDQVLLAKDWPLAYLYLIVHWPAIAGSHGPRALGLESGTAKDALMSTRP